MSVYSADAERLLKTNKYIGPSKAAPYRHASDKWERTHSSCSFLTSALDGGEWSASRFTPPEKDLRYSLDRGLGGRRAGLDTEARGKTLCLFRDQTPVVQCVVRRCTDWAAPAKYYVSVAWPESGRKSQRRKLRYLFNVRKFTCMGRQSQIRIIFVVERTTKLTNSCYYSVQNILYSRPFPRV
jgi:hypothetical protein